MEIPNAQAPLVDALDAQPDEVLKAVIDRARKLLAARERERLRQGRAELLSRAKELGINISIAEQPRRRGRPPKSTDD